MDKSNPEVTAYFEYLKETGETENWQDLAKCQDEDPELFFYPDGANQNDERRRDTAAKQICNVCLVKNECLEWALGSDELYGFWGGLSQDERKRLRRRAA
jgi:WhiB family redox-sensing transcriptional regulator